MTMLKGKRIFSNAEPLLGTQLALKRSTHARTHTDTRGFSIKYGKFEELNNCKLVKYACTLSYTLVSVYPIRFFNKIRGL
jgi:hypothetical protein